MHRHRPGCAALIALALATACSKDPVSNRSPSPDRPSAATAISADRGEGTGRSIAIKDDCDPSDPGWAPTGGCFLKHGKVTFAEFNSMVVSTLGPTTLVGHPAWRNDPSYLRIDDVGTVHVRNEGGRIHTFTQVANFGGGRVPPLNVGMTPAPECASAVDIPSGESMDVTVNNLLTDTFGTHKFQCCIHPWMRAAIKTN
jgi:hypothetical protein